MDGVARPDSNAQLVDDFKFKGAATRTETKSKDVSPEACTICLEPITERAVATPCNHLTFDFLCLVSWLQERATCPLCKAAVTEVQYDWRSPDDFKTYRVPDPEATAASGRRPTEGFRRRRQYGLRRQVGTQRPRAGPAAPATSEDPALEQRRRVYRDRTYSLHVGANRISQYRDFTHETFASSPDLQSRARTFLRRELRVFTFLDNAAAPRGGNRDFLIEYIVAILRTNELKGANGHAEDLLADFVGRGNARLLLHELEAWLRSPYTALENWDRNVQYAGSHSAAAKR